MDTKTVSTNSTIQHFINEIQRQEEKIFIFALRTTAEPPLRGKITKEKIIWRGIKIIRQRNAFLEYSSWVEQRGKQISPKLYVSCMVKPEKNKIL